MRVQAGNAIPAAPADVLAVNGEVLDNVCDGNGRAAQLPCPELLRNGARIDAKAKNALLPAGALVVVLAPQKLLVVVNNLHGV